MQPSMITGSRKSATARVKITPGTGSVSVNARPLDLYFSTEFLRRRMLKPLTVVGKSEMFDVKATVKGGGITGQAEAISHALARSLALLDEQDKVLLNKEKLTTRDPRMVERKKYGQKKARRKFQWVKR